MSTTNFYLKGTSDKILPKLFLVYQSKGKKFKFYTRIKVNKNNWTGIRVVGKSKETAETNALLESYVNYIKEIEREGLFNNKYYPVDVIEKKFRLKVGHIYNANSFFKLYDQFMETSKATKTAGTVRGYGSTKTRLLEYCLKFKIQLTFESINQSFYDGLVNFLLTDLKQLNNTVGKHIKTLKTFLHFVMNNELSNVPMNLKGFKVFREDVDIIYLSENELMNIYNLEDLTQSQQFVKDNFCFACFTGLRFSDLEKINNFQLNGDFLEIKTKKTRDYLRIPLNVYARELITKYKYKFKDSPLPPVISNQKMNECLKEIAEIANVDEEMILEKYSGSTKIVISKPKYNLISTHTARRTFVTLSLEKGIRPEIVMEMTGHHKYETFKKYIKLTDKVKSIEMNKAWSKNELIAV